MGEQIQLSSFYQDADFKLSFHLNQIAFNITCNYNQSFRDYNLFSYKLERNYKRIRLVSSICVVTGCDCGGRVWGFDLSVTIKALFYRVVIITAWNTAWTTNKNCALTMCISYSGLRL